MVFTTLLSLAALLSPPVASSAGESDPLRHFADLGELERHGAPGRIAVFGEDAHALVTGGKAAAPDVMVATARFGRGHVVAVAHESYLGAPSDSALSFLRAAVATAAGENASDTELRVGLWGLGKEATRRLQDLGHDVRTVDGVPDEGAGDEAVDVLLWARPREIPEASVAALIAFVERGGGLVLGVCPWGYEQVGRAQGKELRTSLSMNQVLAPMGLAFAPGTARATGQDGGFAIDVELARAASGHAALDALERDPSGSVSRAGLAMLELAAIAAPDRATAFHARVNAILSQVDVERMPHPDRPLKRDRALERLYVTVESRRWREQDPQDVRAAPGAEHFPGAVPEGAPRVERAASFDAEVRGWQGTGLYAPPGEVLEIEADAPDGWRVLVGCHRDRLWGKDAWRRWPEITGELRLTAGVNRIATPFGGSVYVEANAGGARAESTRIEIRGGVEAPRFRLAELDAPGESVPWDQTRFAPGPWGELEGARLVLSVPSVALRALEDPEPLVRFWDAVVESHLELAGRALPRRERFVADAQISAGYMHSGYPIMTQFDQVRVPKGGGLARVLDVEALRSEGSWGHFHELGHNLQRKAWTFGGTGEVTCNFFSLFTMERVCGIEPWSHPWLEGQKRKAAAYLEAPDFTQWKRQAGLALVTYAQLQREFGWEPFQRILADYEREGRASWPDTDAERIEAFARRFGEAVDRDLRPFFRAWGWPVELRELDGLTPSEPDLLRFD